MTSIGRPPPDCILQYWPLGVGRARPKRQRQTHPSARKSLPKLACGVRLSTLSRDESLTAVRVENVNDGNKVARRPGSRCRARNRSSAATRRHPREVMDNDDPSEDVPEFWDAASRWIRGGVGREHEFIGRDRGLESRRTPDGNRGDGGFCRGGGRVELLLAVFVEARLCEANGSRHRHRGCLTQVGVRASLRQSHRRGRGHRRNRCASAAVRPRRTMPAATAARSHDRCQQHRATDPLHTDSDDTEPGKVPPQASMRAVTPVLLNISWAPDAQIGRSGLAISTARAASYFA